MIYLLIDTCIIKKDLISKIEYSQYLEQIVKWTSDKKLQILCPDTLLEEWTKHKQEENINIQKSISNHERDIKKLNLFKIPTESLIESNTEIAKDTLEKQILDIDQLLENSLKYNSSDHSKIKAIDKHKKGEAPFHVNIKKNSNNDALIIFSTLDYLVENSIDEFYFLTNNHTDFGDILEPKIKINSDITKDYPTVRVNYYTETKLLFEHFYTLGLKKDEFINNNLETKETSNNQFKIKIDKNQNILDQVFHFFEYATNEINLLPIHFITRNEPFKSVKNSYYNFYALHSGNNDLYDLLESIQFNEYNELTFNKPDLVSNVEAFESKAIKIIDSLNENLIFKFSSDNNKNQIEFRFHSTKSCLCVKCQFERFNFDAVYEYLNYDNEKDLSKPFFDGDIDKINLEKAFVHYKLGNIYKSISILRELDKKSKKEKKHLLNFIVNYNLVKLSYVLDFNFLTEHERLALIEELENIDLNQLFCANRESDLFPIFDWIHKDVYSFRANHHIKEYVDKIKNHYRIQLNGGSSNNNNVGLLINEYLKYYFFILKNNINVDYFDEFRDTTELFFEGLICSHAMKDNQFFKYKVFNDWFLNLILLHGKPKNFHKILKKYSLSTLKIHSEELGGNKFINRAIYLLSNFEEILKKNKEFTDKNDLFFKNLNLYAQNAISLSSILDFNKNEISDFTNALIIYVTKSASYQDSEFIKRFIIFKGEEIELFQLKQLFLKIFANSNINDDSVIEIVTDAILKKNELINLTTSVYDKLISDSVLTGKKSNVRFNVYSLCFIHRVLKDKKQKENITLLILENLLGKFDKDLYVVAQSLDVIPDLKMLFNSYIESVNLESEEYYKKQTSFIPSSPNYSFSMSNLVNICFKNKKSFDSIQFHKFKGKVKYYDWLMDMDSFDYIHFEADWITLHPTQYYYRRMSKCNKLKKMLEKMFIEGNIIDKKIKETYIEIFVSKVWKNTKL